jgi:hypothetical protein
VQAKLPSAPRRFLLTLVLVAVLVVRLPPTNIIAGSSVRYVSASGDCEGAAPCDTTIQAALDAAQAGDTIKVSQGDYTTTGTAIATITKAITLSGGYAISDWDTAQPELYPTVLDAENVSGRRGIHIDGSGLSTIVVEGLTVQNGFAENAKGGGIDIVDGTIVLRQLVVRNSSADGTGDRGGGIHVLNGDVTVDRCTIEGNTAGSGGGLYIEDGRLLVKNCVLRQNAAYFGGGVAASILADLDLESNLFEENFGSYGGGAHAESGYGYVTEKRAVGNTFRGNSANYGAGGAEFRGGALLEDNLFERNTAGTGAVGGEPTGGLKVGGPAVLKRNRFFNNTGEYGGAVSVGGPNMLDTGSVTLNANQVRDNQADFAGGALYLSSGSVNATNDVIATNSAPNAGVFVATGQLNASHWTLVGNGAYGVYVDAGTAELTNTIAVSHATAAFWGSVTADYTQFFSNGANCSGTATCTHSLSGSPLFVDPAAGNYHLLPGSIAIDAGKNAGVTTDVDGDLRPLCYAFDLGADEFGPAAACPYATPTVAASRSGSTVILTWAHVGVNATYQAWRGITPYFTPTSVDTSIVGDGTTENCANNAGTVTCTNANAIGNPDTNYFYMVRAFNPEGASADSNRVGEFDFSLTPGSE